MRIENACISGGKDKASVIAPDPDRITDYYMLLPGKFGSYFPEEN